MKKRIFWGLSALLAGGVAFYWYIRVNTFPCGRLDSTSGCVSSVKLETDGLGFAKGEKIEVGYKSFDLASGAGVVAVGLNSAESRYYGIESKTPKRAIVALFNAQDGRLIRIMRQLQSEYSRTEEVALSPDGTLLASYAHGDNENSLIVQHTGDGSSIKTIYDRDRKVSDCLAMLDFSPDNRILQCGNTLHRLDRNETRSIYKNDRYIVPSVALAEFSPGGRAPDGTTVEGNYFLQKKILDRLSPQQREAKLQSLGDNRRYVLAKPGSEPILFSSPLKLYDSSFDRVIFSPDSRLFIETYTAYREARGVRRFVPPPFRQLTAIAIWTRNAELKNSFFANKRYREIAWSRDSQYFAIIDDDFSVQVFKAP